ncbi:MAG: hypothetical protein LBF55_04000 [Prevotellaceae bacterium]|jgi:RsiW-degrading membrane proteinase PrsW (M82 family)|nr:hypothetical protein [Prevotellaceae bacterium]
MKKITLKTALKYTLLFTIGLPFIPIAIVCILITSANVSNKVKRIAYLAYILACLAGTVLFFMFYLVESHYIKPISGAFLSVIIAAFLWLIPAIFSNPEVLKMSGMSPKYSKPSVGFSPGCACF